MPTNEAAAQFDWRNATAIFFVLTGLVLVALSIVWPKLDSGRSAWPDEKALAYQAASSKLHQLSNQVAGTAPEHQTRALQDELAQAQSEYVELRAEFDAARGRPTRIGTMLRLTGILVAVAGVGGLLAMRRGN